MTSWKCNLTVKWLNIPFPTAALVNHIKVKWCRIGKLIVIYSCGIDEVLPDAHGLSCGGQCGTVIVEVFNLDGYCPSSGF